jgi:hypothetical protein
VLKVVLFVYGGYSLLFKYWVVVTVLFKVRFYCDVGYPEISCDFSEFHQTKCLLRIDFIKLWF